MSIVRLLMLLFEDSAYIDRLCMFEMIYKWLGTVSLVRPVPASVLDLLPFPTTLIHHSLVDISRSFMNCRNIAFEVGWSVLSSMPQKGKLGLGSRASTQSRII